MEYIGIDLHRRQFTAAVMDEKGTLLYGDTYDNSQEAVTSLLTHCQPHPSVVIEATRNWMWLVAALREKGCQVSLAHPLKTKAIASARIKTDTLDATTLAHLLRSDLVPGSYIPTSEEQDNRELARARWSLVQQQTHLKNKIHAILGKENLTFSGTDLFGKTGRMWLTTVPLTLTRKAVVGEYLDLLDAIGEKILRIDGMIAHHATGNQAVDILTSIPGVGPTTAFLLASEIGDIHRFPSGEKLAAYLGLVPRLSASGGHAYYGRITKLGNPHVRWALVQTAHRLIRSDPRLRFFAAGVTQRGGKKKAVVAVARKIAVLAWRLLTDNRKYENRPLSTDRRRYST